MEASIDAGLLESVKGFMDDAEGRALYGYALEAGRLGPCLEIGSYCGKSALYIGAACRQNQTVLFSIDHHRGSEEQQPGETYFDPDLLDTTTDRVDTFRFFRRTLEAAGLEDTVVPIVARSETVGRKWATPLGMVFIDGGHAYETVLTDYRVWNRHIVPGGFLLFHDVFPDPADGGQAPYRVFAAARASDRFRELARIGSLGVLIRENP